jgi:hypothetical protein
MKQLIQKMAVMSVTFVLLCVSAAAQNEKSANNIHGVVLDKEKVVLKTDVPQEVKITVLEGFRSPIIMIYEKCVDGRIENKYFSAIIYESKEGYSVKIKAKDIKEKKTATIYFRAMKINPQREKKVSNGQNSNPGNYWGVPLIVEISPK